MEEGDLRRWMAIEARGLNSALTTTQRPLSTLLRLDAPSLETQAGTCHRFDPEVLAAFAAPVSPFLRGLVLLPIRLFVSHQHAGDVFVADMDAAQALVESDRVRTRPRDGRLWVTLGTARDLVKRFPGVFQFVYV